MIRIFRQKYFLNEFFVRLKSFRTNRASINYLETKMRRNFDQTQKLEFHRKRSVATEIYPGCGSRFSLRNRTIFSGNSRSSFRRIVFKIKVSVNTSALPSCGGTFVAVVAQRQSEHLIVKVRLERIQRRFEPIKSAPKFLFKRAT